MSENGTNPTVLVVDDDESFRERLVRAFGEKGYDAKGAKDGESALRLAEEDSPELAVVDLRMPGLGGLEVVRRLKEIDPTTRVLVLTGYGSIATALEAVRLGASHYLAKPASLKEILGAFSRPDLAPAEPASVPSEVPSLARIEWEHISRVLQECGGNITQAAKLLGLHRRSLQRKLAKYPVRR